MAYNPRPWEGLCSQTNRHLRKNRCDDTTIVSHLCAGIPIESIPDGWIEYHHPAEGCHYCYNTNLVVTEKYIPQTTLLDWGTATKTHLNRPIYTHHFRGCPTHEIRETRSLCVRNNPIPCNQHTEYWVHVENMPDSDDGTSGCLRGWPYSYTQRYEECWTHCEYMPKNTRCASAGLTGLMGQIKLNTHLRCQARFGHVTVPGEGCRNFRSRVNSNQPLHYKAYRHLFVQADHLDSPWADRIAYTGHQRALFSHSINKPVATADVIHVGLLHEASVLWTSDTLSPSGLAVGNDTPSASTYKPTKKAIVVGMNYRHSKLPGVGRLRYAIRDSKRVAQSLQGCGFDRENIILLTDQQHREEQKRATRQALMEWINWLVEDARFGDTLFLLFSGHGCNNHPLYGTGLITADDKVISRGQLEDLLVSRVPTGCELQLFVDSCCASSIVQLRHCVRRMRQKSKYPLSPPTVTHAGSQISDLQLYPCSSPIQVAPQVPTLITPTSHYLDYINPTDHGLIHDVTGTRLLGPLEDVGFAPHADMRAATNPRTILQPTTQTVSSSRHVTLGTGHPPAKSLTCSAPRAANIQSHIERTSVEVGSFRGFVNDRPNMGSSVQPAGKVFFWASTGEDREAFEAYSGPDVRDGIPIWNGIMANAICNALDAHGNEGPTMRELWQSLVDDIEQENHWRQERHAKKLLPTPATMIPARRVQLAELWVCGGELSSVPVSLLDRPVFPN